MHLEVWGFIEKTYQSYKHIIFHKRVIWNDTLVERYIRMLTGQVVEFCKPGFPLEWTSESNSLLDI